MEQDIGPEENSKLRPGIVLIYEAKRYTVNCIRSGLVELLDREGSVEEVSVKDIEKNAHFGIKTFSVHDDKGIAEATRRYEIIHDLLLKRRTRASVVETANKNNLNPATIYRWINLYNKNPSLSSLVPEERSGGRGVSRLNNKMEELMNKVIRDKYLNKQRSTIAKVFIELKLECKEQNIQPPSYQTVRRRIDSISDYEKTKHREGRSVARKRFDPKTTSNPDAIFPMSSVQIDHSPMDLLVVDETYRQAIGRPWLTVAIDTYSRMILGYYLGFERPNTMSVGLCISHAILPKEEHLANLDIYKEWPCQGKIGTAHVDNAKEFKSKMLTTTCHEYQIDINWRPKTRPEYGGTIERLVGSIMTQLHDLKGTTFITI